MLARDFTLGDRTFLNVVQRFSRSAIEDENQSGLRGHRESRDGGSVALYVEENRRRFQIVVPDIVMDGLKIPFQLTGLGVESDQTVAEQVCLLAIRTIEVVGWGAVRQINQSQL